MKRAARMDGIAGFGIDRVAAAVLDRDVLRLENLDTDLGLPPEAVAVTRAALDDPVSNSWLPFTGDLGLRAAISDVISARPPATLACTTRSPRSSSPAAAPRACSTCCWRRSTRATR